MVQYPTLDLEAEHVTRSRKAIAGEETLRYSSLFGEPIGKVREIFPPKPRRAGLFAHLTDCR